MNNIQFTSVLELIDFIEHQKRFSPKKGLSKMEYFCKVLGNPEKKFKSIHVTGTNGKGSTVNFLASILTKSGLNVATYTSPYITCFNERIRYNFLPIRDEHLLQIGNYILSFYQQFTKDLVEFPTFFEFTTLMAFLYYANLKDLDLVIVEVGMGGLMDSTNVIMPLISVLSNVGFDHMKVLGNTLEEIEIQKLGIMKKNVPFVSGVKDPHLNEIAKKYALEKNSTIFFSTMTKFEIIKQDVNCSIIRIGNDEYNIGLAGEHQIENGILAIKVIKVINDFNLLDKNISLEEVKLGLKDVSWPGRFETLTTDPLIIVDGAHNIDGITRITEFIKKLPFNYKRCVVAISHDKEKKEMLDLLKAVFDEIVLTEYTYARTEKATVLDELLVFDNKKVIESVDDAINYCFTNKAEFTLFIGSLYLVSDIRKIVLDRKTIDNL